MTANYRENQLSCLEKTLPIFEEKFNRWRETVEDCRKFEDDKAGRNLVNKYAPPKSIENSDAESYCYYEEPDSDYEPIDNNFESLEEEIDKAENGTNFRYYTAAENADKLVKRREKTTTNTIIAMFEILDDLDQGIHPGSIPKDFAKRVKNMADKVDGYLNMKVWDGDYFAEHRAGRVWLDSDRRKISFMPPPTAA